MLFSKKIFGFFFYILVHSIKIVQLIFPKVDHKNSGTFFSTAGIKGFISGVLFVQRKSIVIGGWV